MEHRWSVRKPVYMNVLVYHGGYPGAEARARNIGMEGMFIETGSLPLSKNTVLDVEFTLDVSGEGQRFRVPSFVRHVSERGAGVMFRQFNQDLFRTLHGLLYTAGGMEARAQPVRQAIR